MGDMTCMRGDHGATLCPSHHLTPSYLQATEEVGMVDGVMIMSRGEGVFGLDLKEEADCLLPCLYHMVISSLVQRCRMDETHLRNAVTHM